MPPSPFQARFPPGPASFTPYTRIFPPQDPAQRTIHEASAFGDANRVAEIISGSPDRVACVVQRDKGGYTPLHWAALNNQVAVLDLLLAHGADPHLVDPATGQNPAHWAASRGAVALDAIERLLDAGLTVAGVDGKGYSVLHVAAQFGHTSLVHRLIVHHHATIDLIDHQGRTPLHWAASKGHDQTATVLLALGAKPHAADASRSLPVHCAASRGHTKAAQTLVRAGGYTTLTAVDAEGYTALGQADRKKHPELAKSLQKLARQDVHYPPNQHWLWGRTGLVGRTGIVWVIWTILLGGHLLWLTLYYSGQHSLFGVATAFNHAVYLYLLLPLSCLTGWLLYRTTTMDPGTVPTYLGDTQHLRALSGATATTKLQWTIGASPALVEDEHWDSICVTCRVVKPLRAKHCNFTNRCVEEFDHYCPWVGNTVGKRNRGTFVLMLWGMVLTMVVFLYLNYARFAERPVKGGSKEAIIDLFRSMNPAWYGFVVQNLFILLIAGGTTMLLYFQMQSIFVNLTANEMANWFRYPHFRDPVDGRFRNPFDLGWKHNLMEVVHADTRPMLNPYLSPEQKSMRAKQREGAPVTKPCRSRACQDKVCSSGKGHHDHDKTHGEVPVMEMRGKVHDRGTERRPLLSSTVVDVV